MATLDDIAAQLADDTVKLMKKTGEDRMYYEVAKVLGASSQTLEEAFLTEIRVRLAGEQARAFLKQKFDAIAAAEARQTAPQPPAPTAAVRIDPAVKAASIQAITGRPPAKPTGR
ncbi:hypothetical protein [Halocynthiibacter namhaensis]|uniref:hypothetical protein n=1 Tax=Halocynthiibacter namhaensis TaxID=1290553 RepID=UPI000A9B1EB9